MDGFHFYHPIEVRYGDLDPQGHLNNAKYLTFFEQARISYLAHIGVWTGSSFLDIGVILADAHITFRSPVLFGQQVHVGVRVSRMGTKSLTMEYRLEDIQTGDELATGASVLVAYDYHSGSSIPIPGKWREAIIDSEDLPEEQLQ